VPTLASSAKNELIDEQPVDHVGGDVGDPRLVARARPRGHGREGLQPDDDHPIRAQVQGGLDRAVEPGAAIDVMAPGGARGGDLDRGEEKRDRRRCPHMLAAQTRLDVAQAILVVRRRPLAAGHESNRTARGKRRRDHAHRVDHSALDVAGEHPPVGPAIEARAQRGGIEKAGQAHPIDAESMREQPEHRPRPAAAGDRRDHVALAQVAPPAHGLGHLLIDG
jgi:hypothetical protein